MEGPIRLQDGRRTWRVRFIIWMFENLVDQILGLETIGVSGFSRK